MCQSGPERRNIPLGMFSRQNSIGRPTTTVWMPRSRAKPAVDSAYGPAPTTRSSVVIIGPPHLLQSTGVCPKELRFRITSLGYYSLRVARDRYRNVRVGDCRGAASVVDDVADAAHAVCGIQEDGQQVVHLHVGRGRRFVGMIGKDIYAMVEEAIGTHAISGEVLRRGRYQH